jgi:hypothetical protein
MGLAMVSVWIPHFVSPATDFLLGGARAPNGALLSGAPVAHTEPGPGSGSARAPARERAPSPSTGKLFSGLFVVGSSLGARGVALKLILVDLGFRHWTRVEAFRESVRGRWEELEKHLGVRLHFGWSLGRKQGH